MTYYIITIERYQGYDVKEVKTEIEVLKWLELYGNCEQYISFKIIKGCEIIPEKIEKVLRWRFNGEELHG